MRLTRSPLSGNIGIKSNKANLYLILILLKWLNFSPNSRLYSLSNGDEILRFGGPNSISEDFNKSTTRYMQDERPAEVPFRILNELELLEIASQICNERLMSNCSPDRDTDKDVRSMIELTSDMRSRDLITSSRTPSSSPPSYQETVTKPHITIPDLAAEPPEKRQRTARGDLLLSSMKPVVSSLHPQNIIDNILRASLMTQQAAAQIMTSQNHNMMASQTPLMMSSMMETLSPPPFSPLSPNSPDTWPGALQALLGITSVKPKLVSKNDALMGLDKFIAFVEQQQNVAAILKDVLYEYRKYAMHKL